MSAPDTVRSMLRAGYVRHKDGNCKSCAAAIAWFKTSRARMMPVNLPIANDDVAVTPHWATCPDADKFKGPQRKAEQTERERTKAVETLLGTSGARVVIALYPEGAVTAWINGLEPEDTRNELITAANQVRWQLRTAIEGGR